VHGTRIGALVLVKGGDASLAHDLAMHVAASNPKYRTMADVPAEVVAKEREILTEQAQARQAPGDRCEDGRRTLRKSLGEITAAGPAFVKDPDVTIEKLLKRRESGSDGLRALRKWAPALKEADDFVAEVMAQVKGATH